MDYDIIYENVDFLKLKAKILNVVDIFKYKYNLIELFKTNFLKIINKDLYLLKIKIKLGKTKINLINSLYKKKIEFITNKVKHIYKNIIESQTEINRKIEEIRYDVGKDILEFNLDKIKDIYDKKYNSIFKYYPERYDLLFNKKIFEKKEFNECKISILNFNIIEKKNKLGFKKTQTQKFIKNYISQNTPYNGLLIWHGVGAGKTCAAIGIAENFKNILYNYDKKILILTPSETLKQNWKDEIFNLEKELNKEKNNMIGKNVQCTGMEYLKELQLFDFRNKTYDQNKRKINKIINKHYEILGYQVLANSIKKDLENLLMIKKKNFEFHKIQYIKNRFSNRVIIMDEIHVTRKGSNKSKEKLARPYLEMIARYSTNTKLILLTATPMYNISSEIIWLVNLLLWNDKLSPVFDVDIFEKNGDTLKNVNSLNILKKKTRGYISYLRGENPFTFPIKLYPFKNVYNPKPSKYISKGQIEKLNASELIDNKKIFFKNQMSNWQYYHVRKNYLNFTDNDESFDSQVNTFSIKVSQASNIVFPSNLSMRNPSKYNCAIFDKIGFIGDNSINKVFNIIDNKYNYKHNAILNNSKSFLHRTNIEKYSIKFKNILNSIIKSNGIIFIFSQFIDHGIKAFALFLEENGFMNYTGKGLSKNFLQGKKDPFCINNKKYFSELDKLKTDKKERIQGKFIYLDGKMPKLKLNNLVKEAKGQGQSPWNIDNNNGKHIKIILGSRVIEQGVSLFNVREIHILDPWYHLNMLEQAAGRGIRNMSHINLPRQLRNVTLFIHIASLPLKLPDVWQNDENLETSDERIYRIAFNKKKNMALIERTLKKNSIDCFLNKKGNIFTDENYGETNSLLRNHLIMDSQNFKRSDYIGDLDYSLNCDLLKCNYNCDWEKSKNNVIINDDTFDYEFSEDTIQIAKEIIKDLYKVKYFYKLRDIIRFVNLNEKIKKIYIYLALDDIVNFKEELLDKLGRLGYLIYRNKYYIFQPKNINDENIPLWYRMKPLPYLNKNFELNYNKKKPLLIRKIDKPDSKNIDKHLIISHKNYEYIINLLNDSEKFINDKYREYKNIKIFHKLSKFPNKNDMLYVYKIGILDRLSYISKKLLLEKLLIKVIETTNGLIIDIEKNSKLTHIEKFIFKYYDSFNHNYSIFRLKRDLYERLGKTTDKSIIEDKYKILFRVVNDNKIEEFYEYNKVKKLFELSSSYDKSLLDPLKIKKKTIYTNNTPIFGFIKIFKSKPKFYIVNNILYQKTYNIDGNEQKKTRHDGAVCGTALGCRKKPEIISTINYLIKYNNPGKSYIKYNSLNMSKISKDKNYYLEKSLCQELELLLRYYNLIRTDSDIFLNKRFFYLINEYKFD